MKVKIGLMALVLASINVFGATQLTTLQKEKMKFMVQEEKMARDVYLVMAKKYTSKKIFSNIASAEQKHIEAVFAVGKRSGVNFGNMSNQIGVFTDARIAAMYTELIKRGSVSQAEAINVGISIEKIDISDLLAEQKEFKTSPEVSKLIVNLVKASQQHLSAFTKNAK